MAKMIVVGGPSSSGKSTSYARYKDEDRKIDIKGLDPEETFLIMSTKKLLPTAQAQKDYTEFKIVDGKPQGNMLVTRDYMKIKKVLQLINKSKKIKNIVIDDFQYLMSMDFFDRKDEAGFDKFGKIGFSVVDLIDILNTKVRENVYVFLLTHTSTEGEGKETVEHLKTIGRMLDEKFTFEGLFLPVLIAEKEWKKSLNRPRYYFKTEPAFKGDIAKSPLGMFNEAQIPNDLGIVKESLDKYLNQ